MPMKNCPVQGRHFVSQIDAICFLFAWGMFSEIILVSILSRDDNVSYWNTIGILETCFSQTVDKIAFKCIVKFALLILNWYSIFDWLLVFWDKQVMLLNAVFIFTVICGKSKSSSSTFLRCLSGLSSDSESIVIANVKKAGLTANAACQIYTVFICLNIQLGNLLLLD